MKKKVVDQAGYRCKGNVMTPINWFGGVFEATLIPNAAWQHDNWVGIACIVLAALMFFAYFGVYIYFMLRNPDRLQSEEFNLYQKELTLEGTVAVISTPHVTTAPLPYKSDKQF